MAFVCNAFNLNLSSWVGAVALRYRLYSRLGLDIADITRILTFSLVTNWFGYPLLAGILFSCGLPAAAGLEARQRRPAPDRRPCSWRWPPATCWPAVSPDAAPGAGASIG